MSTKKIKIYQILVFGFIASLGFQSLFVLPIVGQKIQLSELFFFTIFTVSIFDFLKNRKAFDFQWTTFDLIILSYPIVVFISSLANGGQSVWIEFLGVSYLFGTYFMLKSIFSKWKLEELYDFLFHAFMWCGFLIAVVGLIGWGLFYFFEKENPVTFVYENYPYFGDVIRVKGFLPSPHMVASILNISILFFLSKVFYQKPIRPLYSLFFVLIILVYFLTFAKIVILLLLAIGLLFLYKNKTSISRTSTIGVYSFYSLMILGYLFAIHFLVVKKQAIESGNFQKERFHTNIPIAETKDHFIIPTSYFALKKSAFLMGMENPISGVGPGNHESNLEALRASGNYPNHMLNYAPHSTYFGAFAELGLLGFAAVIFIFLNVGKRLKRFSKGKSLPIISKVLMAVFFIAAVEAISTDIMNFRHYWVLLTPIPLFLKKKNSISS